MKNQPTKNVPAVPATAVANSDVPEETIALSITQQYDFLINATQEIVRRTLHFGSALAQAEIELGRRGLLNNRKNGQGMQGWLAAHCPSVNYKTAMRWKTLAVNVANSLSCTSDQALKLLAGDTTIDVPSKVTDKLNTVYEQSSLRKLTQLMFDFASEGGNGTAGRPSGTGATTPTEKFTAMQSAQRLWARFLAFAVKNRAALLAAAKLLPIENARDASGELKQLASAISARLKTN